MECLEAGGRRQAGGMAVSEHADSMRTIWYEAEEDRVCIIDQTQLPHRLQVMTLATLADASRAIIDMQVRGAPLIGITAAFGVYLSLKQDPSSLSVACQQLGATRPTAINLQWALSQIQQELQPLANQDRAAVALGIALRLLAEDAGACSAIGDYGLPILAALLEEKTQQTQATGEPVVLNVLTHCNAGWLATGGWGTALAPIYKAHLAGLPVHVWVDETRPRNQGASLTAWELGRSGVPHTLITDNTGGHLMQHGMVDICIVGSDRTTRQGDVCNKIGTYLKALAARDNDVPFYVALPASTIDFAVSDGVREIPIETRSADEVNYVQGLNESGVVQTVRVSPADTKASNYGFDVTPARLVSGLITELGVFSASEAGLSDIAAALENGKGKQAG